MRQLPRPADEGAPRRQLFRQAASRRREEQVKAQCPQATPPTSDQDAHTTGDDRGFGKNANPGDPPGHREHAHLYGTRTTVCVAFLG